MESILTSIKKMLGIDAAYDHFDPDIILHINSALAALTQLGVGPPEGYRIFDAEDTWDTFLGEDPKLSFVKDYVYLKVRLIFDPPTSGAVLDSMKEMLKEFEFRSSVEVDPNETEKEG